jgi:carboxyl-terminal processing protease
MAKSIIINQNLRYLDHNRASLKAKYPDFETFRKNFTVPTSLIDAIYKEAEKQKIECPKEEREQTVSRLTQMLKALIARDIWDMSEYFSIIYEDDPIVLKAIEKLSE